MGENRVDSSGLKGREKWPTAVPTIIELIVR